MGALSSFDRDNQRQMRSLVTGSAGAVSLGPMRFITEPRSLTIVTKTARAMITKLISADESTEVDAGIPEHPVELHDLRLGRRRRGRGGGGRRGGYAIGLLNIL